MKIVIAPDSFKESLTAQQVAEAIKRGFQQSIADVECLLCPVGDGGEGTVDAIRHSLDLSVLVARPVMMEDWGLLLV